jgi:HEPN domain-containing protein
MPDDRHQAVRELVTEWMRRARADLVLANMVKNEEIDPEIIAFHAQQAAEKAIKALLIQRQVEFPRTHIIGVLLTLCKDSGYVLGGNLDEAVRLSEYAVSARYPGEMSEVNRQEAEIAVELANRVFDWAEKQIEDV